MLDGLDSIAWHELAHAYGGAEDTPGLIRQAASADRGVVSQAISDLHGSIFHQGTVYPATVIAVPFLAELAVGAPNCRAEFVWMIGMLADDRHAVGAELVQVQAAVSAQSKLLVALLFDGDPSVREAAAYATTRAGVSAEVLWRCWAVERVPAVRASLALALGEVDRAAARMVLGGSTAEDEPQVTVAAAVALLRAGFDWPEGTVPSLVTAIEDGGAISWAWARGAEWSEEIVVTPPVLQAAAVVEHMLRSGDPNTRRTALWALSARCDALRSAPPVFVPLVAPLLDDADRGVHEGVLNVLRRAGAAAGQFADAVAAVAGRWPETAGDPGFTVEYRAVETLQRLGDPRWIEPVCRAAGLGHRFRFRPGAVRFTPEVLSAVQIRLATEPATVGVLAAMIGHWGSNGAALVSDLLAAMDQAGPQIAQALLMLGHDAHAAVPHWRTQARSGDLQGALAVRRLTGDTGVVLDALSVILAGDARTPWTIPSELDNLGDALAPLMPIAGAHLTGTAARAHPQRDKQILAARVVAAVAGPGGVLTTVEAVLAEGDTPARHAADLIADLAEESPASVAHLQQRLRDSLEDRWSRLSAARALARLGVPTAQLARPLIRGITDYGGRYALAIILELRAVEALPALAELLSRDKRCDVGNSADDTVWADEILQDQIRDTIARLRNP